MSVQATCPLNVLRRQNTHPCLYISSLQTLAAYPLIFLYSPSSLLSSGLSTCRDLPLFGFPSLLLKEITSRERFDIPLSLSEVSFNAHVYSFRVWLICSLSKLLWEQSRGYPLLISALASRERL
jgi:hypothetical protein